MSIFKRVGQALNLSLQLRNGDADMPLRVFVDLIDQDGVQLEPTFEIPHIDGGQFVNTTKIMPNIETLYARFKVRENDGSTVPDGHDDPVDRYDRDDAGQRVVQFLDQPVSALEANPDSIVGIIERDDEIFGIIDEQPELVGVIDEC